MTQVDSQRAGIILCVSGPSGVGKDTVIQALLEAEPRLCYSISTTTREPRGQERDGVDYFFTDADSFMEMVREGEILEYDEYCGNYYGTPATYLRQQAAAGHDVLLDVTVSGSFSVQKVFPEAIMIFLLPPSPEVLETRLRLRGTESERNINGRMQQARDEIKKAHAFDYVVVNDKLSETVDTVLAICRAESHRVSRRHELCETLINAFN